MADYNKKTMGGTATTEPLDFVLYGDSITAVLAVRKKELWSKYFGHVRAMPMGVGASTVETLTWRMMQGGERPPRAPRVMAFLIGTNNRTAHQQAASRLEYLLRWVQREYPTSRLILFSILPEKMGSGFAAKNELWKRLAAKLGITFATCGQSLNPSNPALMPDGLHPSDAAYDQVLPCMVSAAGL